MSLKDSAKILSRGKKRGSGQRVYTESSIKETLKNILDKRRKYTPTNEWVVNVEDIKEEFGFEVENEE